MTIYYVSTGGNNGTALTTATAKTTISAGCLLAVAGDTVRVLAGSYNGGIFISTSYADGTTASPITLISFPALAAQIRALGAPAVGGGNDALIEIRANGWTIDGFEITGEDGYDGSNAWTLGGAGQYRQGIFLSGLNLIAQNNWIHHTCQADPAGSGGGGIYSEGFYVSYASQNNYIRYNTVNNHCSSLTANKAHGIYITGADTHVQSNLIYNGFGGVMIHGWHGFDGGSYSNNTIFNCTNVGMLIGQGDGGAASGTAGFRGFNNTVQNCGVAIDEQGIITTPRNVWSNNHIFNCTTTYSINSTSTAVNTLSNNPLMVNYVQAGGGDYHLSAGSPLIGAGIASLTGTLASSFDIDGTARPQGGTYDVGAYEFLAGSAPDTTSPNLSSPIGSATGQTTGVGRVVTDEANGTAYCWATTNAVESSANIIANGDTTSVAVAATITFVLSGLNAATTYFNHFTQLDLAGNTATLVVNSGSFTTASPPAGTNTSVLGGSIRRILHIR